LRRNGHVIFFPNSGTTLRFKRAKRIKILKELCQSKDLVFRLRKTMDHFFPGLYARLREIEDYRQDPDYKLAAIIIAAIALFLFKCGSRNDLNNERKKEQFRKNYSRVFKVNLPHMDTVERVLRHLDEEVFEKLKVEMIQILITKKIPKKERFSEKYYQVAFDGCHVFNVKKNHCSSCLTSTSKKGKVRYFHVVVEAKLVTSNGFCFPLATEWVENPEGDFDKQDCEKNAFGRLADKLKKTFPQLPICVLADGLYPNEPFFNICQEKGWEWIVTFKNGNLPSVSKQKSSRRKHPLQS